MNEAVKSSVIVVVNDELAVDWEDDMVQTVSLQVDHLSSLIDRLEHFKLDVLFLFSDNLPSGSLSDLRKLTDFCEERFLSIGWIGSTEMWRQLEVGYPDVYFPERVELAELKQVVKTVCKRRKRILDHVLVDTITGVNTVRFLKMELETFLYDLRRSYEAFSIVTIKADDLTIVDENEKYAIGSKLIQFIKGSVRPTDFLALHPVSGLVLLLPKTVKVDALKLMKRLEHSFSEQVGSFFYRVIEIADPTRSVEQCLALIEKVPSSRVEDDLQVTDIRRIKIAVIDDDRLIRELLHHQLADFGGEMVDVEVKGFVDGEAFFADPWHRQNERFVIIIDQLLPKMGGLEILRIIQTKYDRKRYNCLLLGREGREADIAIAIRSGANDYLAKPFSLRELRSRMNRLLGLMLP
ncbi:response regulator [Gottfriedia acidiceleris]|uniref:Response regulator n=1 Tax=Gottfriedia acidiceleris TaxID=371036 RepID=A0ABY4JU73_9BACI|nr:response regulator [Gottfriedia acidiceleris]UPM56358.1 response regulator [Gottfriedia acidiceleris]